MLGCALCALTSGAGGNHVLFPCVCAEFQCLKLTSPDAVTVQRVLGAILRSRAVSLGCVGALGGFRMVHSVVTTRRTT